MKARIVTVIGTDTDVGKTAIVGTLVRILRQQHICCGICKPIQSGAVAIDHPDGDAARLIQWSGVTCSPADICRFSFPAPLAPPVAAARAGTAVQLAQLVETARSVAEQYDLTIVETAGGALSPVAADGLSLDLATALGGPVIIVARASLGTINHSLLTLAAVRRTGLPLIGLVLNGANGADAELDAPALIRQFGGDIPIFGPLPQLHPFSAATMAPIITGLAPGLLQALAAI